MVFVKGYQQMYSTQKNWSNTFLTDPDLVRALGPFSVDVCCPPVMPWKTARRMIHEDTGDGLADDWGRGRVWMNPPYRGVIPWAQKFVAHANGIALVNGRSAETRATQLLLGGCAAAFFPAGRLAWYDTKGEVIRVKTGEVARWLGSLLIGMTALDAEMMSYLPERGFPGVLLRGPRA